MVLPVIYNSIPKEMKHFKNWVLWRLENKKDKTGKVEIDPKTGNPKETKVPYQRNGKKADPTNSDTWDIYDYIEATGAKKDGIGFVFSEDTRIIGIDWDDVRDNKTGEWDKEALEEILSLGSYAELSQSGTGAHVLIKGVIPGERRRKGNIEIYSKERFFVVTGQHIEETPTEIKENQEAINELYKKRFGESEPKKKENKKQPENRIKLSDSEIIDIANRAKNSDKFKSLYSGNISGYNSDSDADMAFCALLAFYTGEETQIDRIFRRSGLYREKWERADYRDRTINTALHGVTETYNPENKGKRKAGKGKPEKIMVNFDEVAKQILEQNEIFSMRDNKQIYLYIDGVYKNEGVEAILDTRIRNIHDSLFVDKWTKTNPDFDLPEHIPKAKTGFITEVLAYIRSYTHIPREIIEEDQAKYINFKNCLFNLKTWEIENHRSEVKTICQIPVFYDPKAEYPQIDKFIREVAKPEDIDFLEEWAGYCLTTDVSFQKALMLYGQPGTGKSVFALLLETFIGQENSAAESLQKIEEDKYRAAKLYGKRVNICSDIPSTRMHKTEVFKKLVSGLDTIDAENKYQDPFKFKNKAKLTFSANKLPEGPKDPAFYERFCLIEFSNKFRGTEKDDKNLFKKLTGGNELSGFLNLALKGLKRLYENDKFSYSKTFEETEREYILNSNPVAFFMDECTEISQNDIDGTILYCAYVDWSSRTNKQKVSNIEFSRKLSKMGYTNHRENIKADGSKKIIKWDNLKLKPSENTNKEHTDKERKDDFGQDLGQDHTNRSCPKKSSHSITENLTKIDFGQDRFSCVELKTQNYLSNCDNLETVKMLQIGKNENIPNRSKTSCPSVRFFDSGEYGQDVSKHPVRDLVREQKKLFSEQPGEEDSIKKIKDLSQMRKDLETFRSTYLRTHGGIESIEIFVGEFLKGCPGYLLLFVRSAIIYEAEKICKKIPIIR